MRLSLIGLILCTSCLFAISVANARWEANGQVELEARTFPTATGQARATEFWTGPEIELEFKPSGNFRRWRMRSVLHGQFLTIGKSDPGNLNQSGSPHVFEDQELYFEYRSRNHRVRIGTQVLKWGIVDLYDPLDQVNSRRFENPLSAAKRGDPMLYWSRTSISKPSKGSQDEVAFTSELFLTPFRRTSLMPSQASTWLPRKLYIPNLPDTEFVLPEALEYKYLGREELDDSLQLNFGARLGWRFSSSEVSLQYDEGGSTFPSLRPSVSGTVIALAPRLRIQADPLIELTEVYFRERHFGFSVTQTFDSLLIRGQIAKSEPMFKGRTLSRDRSDMTIGIEYGISNTTLLAQFFYNSLSQNDGGNDLASFSSVFDKAAALGWRMGISETASLMIGALHSFPGANSKSGTVALLNASFDFSEHLSCEIGWTLIEAQPEAPLGPFNDNDGGFLKLTAAF